MPSQLLELEVASTYTVQQWDTYSEENHRAWRMLYRRMVPKWERFANPRFLEGLGALALDPVRIPRLDEVNRFLCPLTGFRACAVSGYVPAFVFFDCLRNREFPTTVTIRPSDRLDYLPEPDIFHDIAGHVPMHTDPDFAETLVRFGHCAHTAAEIVAGIRDEELRISRLTSILRAMARFFWFTIEFGLMRTRAGLRAYGSGLLSSFGELEHSLLSPDVQRCPIRMEWVVNQCFEIDQYQPLLFTVSGFDHLYSLVDELEQWMRNGRLDNVAGGEPALREEDLKSFLHRTVS
ncbi:MAG: phenylalanine 4-monooxygenase [Bryobacteraceae bacterium]|nr:phenylalanine 4-monooxygenase [Bryobacteraceae bacterium]